MRQAVVRGSAVLLHIILLISLVAMMTQYGWIKANEFSITSNLYSYRSTQFDGTKELPSGGCSEFTAETAALLSFAVIFNIAAATLAGVPLCVNGNFRRLDWVALFLNSFGQILLTAGYGHFNENYKSKCFETWATSKGSSFDGTVAIWFFYFFVIVGHVLIIFFGDDGGGNDSCSCTLPAMPSMLSSGGGGRKKKKKSKARKQEEGKYKPPSNKKIIVAKFDCDAEKADELTFRKGDRLEMIAKDSDEWWVAKKGNRQGLVPANYFA